MSRNSGLQQLDLYCEVLVLRSGSSEVTLAWLRGGMRVLIKLSIHHRLIGTREAHETLRGDACTSSPLDFRKSLRYYFLAVGSMYRESCCWLANFGWKSRADKAEDRVQRFCPKLPSPPTPVHYASLSLTAHSPLIPKCRNRCTLMWEILPRQRFFTRIVARFRVTPTSVDTPSAPSTFLHSMPV